MKQQHTKGYYFSIGIAIGIPIGIPLGFALGNIALGPAIGLPIGVLLGAFLENRFNKKPLELSTEEQKLQKRFGWILLGVGIITFLLLLSAFFLFKY